jgi:hypothetical protein
MYIVMRGRLYFKRVIILFLLISIITSTTVLAISPSLNSECNGKETKISLSDSSILCLGTENLDDEPVCLKDHETGNEDGNHKFINQMYSNVWRDSQAQDTYRTDDISLNQEDYLDIAAISADYFFGDKTPFYNGYSTMYSGDGFSYDNNDQNDGDEKRKKGSSAKHSCLQENSMPTSETNGANTYGPESYEAEDLIYVMGDKIYPFFYCGGGDKGELGRIDYDLEPNDHNPDGKIVTHKIYNNDLELYQYKAWVCDVDKWVTLEDYVASGKNDNDNDDVPDWSEWDCDSNNPNIYADLSVFVNTETGEQIFGASPEICGDGQPNTCVESALYTNLNAYEDNGIADNGELIEIPEDNCELNPTACEEQCLFAGGKCSYLNYIPEGSDPSATTTIGPEGIGGYCCGNNLYDDLGSTAESSAGVSNICVNQNFVTPDIAEFSEPSSDGWAWLDAEGNEKFNIFTIRYLSNEEEQTSFDIVSDSKEWQVCKDTEAFLDGSNYGNTDANRFLCYQEGDHYSLVECSEADTGTTYNADVEANVFSVKHRAAATGAFALPLIKDEGNDNRYYTDLTDVDNYVNSYDEIYTVEGTLEQTIDFTGYDNLELFVKFTNDDITLPEALQLTILGLPQVYPETETGEEMRLVESEEVTYFDQNVLGYAVNSPLIETNNVIHLRVPVGEWPDIEIIEIESNSPHNTIEVLGMYLTRDEDITSDEVLICSGEDDTDDSSWLTDLDESSSSSSITGKRICQSRYGENAWLGDSYLEEVFGASAPCCGDDQNEFYSSKSLNDFACFNARPIENGATAMQIEYEVTYASSESEVSYPEEDIELEDFSIIIPIPDIKWACECNADAIYEANGWCDESNGCECYIYECDETSTAPLDYQKINVGSREDSCINKEYSSSRSEGVSLPDAFVDAKIPCEIDSRYTDSYEGTFNTFTKFSEEVPNNHVAYVSEGGGGYYKHKKTSFDDSLTYITSPAIIYEDKVTLSSLLQNIDTITLELPEHQNDDVKVYFFTPHNQHAYNPGESITIDYESNFPPQFDLYIVAETSIIETQTEETTVSKPFSYTCLSEECVYALPGNAPYEITNLYPQLYDMYFINEEREETLITTSNQPFTEFGNIKVNKIAQQVLFDYDQDEQEGGFYGCQAADLITTDLTNFDYCTVQGDYYCAHQDNKRLVNSWSKDLITEIGYEPVDEFDEDTELTLQIVSYDATLRNHSTASVPQRNIVPNADFDYTQGSDVLYWHLLDGSTTLVDNEQSKVEDGIFDISSSYTLKSEKIAVQPYETYSYSDSSEDCQADLYLIDNNGVSEYVSVPEYFESLQYSSLIINVDGSCNFQEPMLQRVDDLGANNYEYNPEFPQRQGAACCPDDMCYNGYTCINNMAEYTYMTEEPQENMTYRCIDGTWSYLEPQYDWNGEEFGFCETNTQCFVTSSLSEGAEYEATNEDFYEGKYPFCLNEGEYLLDHYCEAGEWSSRTKFLATKLLEFAETDDFVLYCAPFSEAFPDYNTDGYNYQNYLSGEVSTTLETTDSLGSELSGESSSGETIEVCYDALENSETGRRLVKQEDNTCVNAVCVLQYKSGNEFAAAFATSMNHNITSDESFLIPLGVSQGDLETYCSSEETTDYIQCDDALWYTEEINSVIYAKDGISFDPSIIDNIVSWFFGIFGADVIEDSENFIQEANNFNTLYLLSKNDQVIKAVQEVEPDKETLVAEFEGFDTPICDYVNNVNDEYTIVEQWPADPEYLVDCELTEDGVYRIMTATNTDYWWPQLTSKIRVTNQ